MNMIVLDLEWNTVSSGGSAESKQHFDEIIQIGAVRLDEDYTPADTFNAYVRNQSGSLSPIISQLVHLTDEDLASAEEFPSVARRFLSWCGDSPRFFTWSNSDVPVLRQNLRRYGLKASLRRAYNVQFAYSILKINNTSAVALNKAVETFGLSQEQPFHSALSDAVYTAQVMELLWKEFGGKIHENYLYSQLQKLRAAKKQQTKAPLRPKLKTAESFEAWLQAPGRYSVSRQHRQLPCNSHRKAYFRQTGTRTFTCPRCKRTYSGTKWLQIQENRYANHFSCGKHGTYYALMRLRRKNPYLWEGIVDLYTEADSPWLTRWVNEHPEQT